MKYIYLLLVLFISLPIAWINCNLHSEKLVHEGERDDIIHQLNFLENELKENRLGMRMQQIFPEGYIFANALYGLSWCEIALADTSANNDFKERAIHEALFAYKEIDSGKAKWNFDETLDPACGIFYSGWRNYLLSKIISVYASNGISPAFQNENVDAILKDSTNADSIYFEAFKKQCNDIAEAMRQSPTPYLQSYYMNAWPADMCMAVASLSIYDKLFKPLYKGDIDLWVKQVKENLDPLTKTIPHSVNYLTGESVQGSEGNSMVLMLRVLAEIDPQFAKEQYALFKENFVSKVFGLPAVRQYPKGISGKGDVDSGPVILGVGFAATLASIGTFTVYGDNDLANQQFLTVHAFGFSRTKGVQKKYLGGILPIADAFIAWSRATEFSIVSPKENSKLHFWRFKFHAISILILLVLWFPFYRKSLVRKIQDRYKRGK